MGRQREKTGSESLRRIGILQGLIWSNHFRFLSNFGAGDEVNRRREGGVTARKKKTQHQFTYLNIGSQGGKKGKGGCGLASDCFKRIPFSFNLKGAR